MGLKAFLSTLDGIDESISQLYREDQGGYILDVEEYTGNGKHIGLADTSGLKSALDKERKSVKDLSNQVNSLNSYKELGLSVEEIRDMQLTAGNANRDLESMKQQLQDKYNKDLEAKVKEKDDLYNQLISANHKNAVSNLLAKDGANIVDNEGVREFLMQNLMSQTKVDASGNTYVVNQDGTTRYTNAIGSADPMSVGELWAEMKSNPKYSFAIKSSGASGSGASGSSSSGSSNITAPQSAAEWNSMDQAARVAFYRSNPAKATELANAGAKLR